MYYTCRYSKGLLCYPFHTPLSLPITGFKEGHRAAILTLLHTIISALGFNEGHRAAILILLHALPITGSNEGLGVAILILVHAIIFAHDRFQIENNHFAMLYTIIAPFAGLNFVF